MLLYYIYIIFHTSSRIPTDLTWILLVTTGILLSICLVYCLVYIIYIIYIINILKGVKEERNAKEYPFKGGGRRKRGEWSFSFLAEKYYKLSLELILFIFIKGLDKSYVSKLRCR